LKGDSCVSFDDDLGLDAHQLPGVDIVGAHRADIVEEDEEGTYGTYTYNLLILYFYLA
jgi:hypothetical protein